MISIQTAGLAQLDALVPLFDAYRVFYQQDSDVVGARAFLGDRIRKKESIIFIAVSDGVAVGFTQLFFSFSSVSLMPSLILNDLFVAKHYRNQGVAGQLLSRAKTYCASHRYKGLALETAMDNPAQKLYEKLGWKKDSDCFHYFWVA